MALSKAFKARWCTFTVYSQYSVTTITANEAPSVDGKHITKCNRERKSVSLYVVDKNNIAQYTSQHKVPPTISLLYVSLQMN